MKLAIVVGHNSASQGAVRKDTGESEFVWNGRLARRIERLAGDYGLQVRTFFRTPGGGYSTEIRRVYAEVDAWGADASVELHFNGASSAEATGTETLSSGSALSLRLAESVQREMVLALGLRDRGIKTRSSSDRGGMSLISGRAPAILVEPFFGSSPVGNRATDEEAEQERLADAILRGTAEAFQSFPRSTLTESRTIKAAETQRKAATGGVWAGAGAAVASVSEAVIGDAQTAIEAAGIGARLAEYLPWIGGGLAAITVILFVASRVQADQIEEARVDDHERGVR